MKSIECVIMFNDLLLLLYLLWYRAI